MLEKLKAQPWHIQLIVLVALASVIYGAFWYFLTSDIRAEVARLNDEAAQQASKNREAEIATEHITEFRALYASKSMEYDELKVLLPEEREITNVLQGLQDTAGESRLIVSRFSPRDDVMQDSMMSKPVEIEVDSNFNNLRAFFDKMAKLQRIVSITDFKLNQLDKQSSDRTLHAQFLLTAYYAAPENLVNANGVPGQVPTATPNPDGTMPVAPDTPPVATPAPAQ